MTNVIPFEPREKRGEARQKGSALLGSPIVHQRNRGTAGSRGRTAENRDSADGLQAPGRLRGPSADRVAELAERRTTLLGYLEECDRRLYHLQGDYDRLKAAFDAAHGELAWAWGDRDFSAEARERRRPLYDARMAAGHAWCPVRNEYRDLERWRKATVIELRGINAEIGE